MTSTGRAMRRAAMQGAEGVAWPAWVESAMRHSGKTWDDYQWIGEQQLEFSRWWNDEVAE